MGRECQRAEDRFPSRVNCPVGIDELNRSFALLARQFGKSFCNARVLKGDVLDALARGFMPA